MLPVVVLLAVVEGLTEFIPVSSTGHLVVASELAGFNPAWREPFLVVIQLGAIFAVVVDRWTALMEIVKSGQLVRFATLLFLGFFPSAVLGLLLHEMISALLKAPAFVSAALITGGILILFLDRPRTSSAAVAEADRAASPEGSSGAALIERVTHKQALLVGFAQCLSLWPGMSRSASTILGGLAVGLDRPSATLFSFYLAIPTMFAASGYELLKNRDSLEGSGLAFAVGMLVSFGVAWLTVRWLLRYVQTHTFRPFAAYRIVAGAVILLLPAEWWS